MTVRRLFQILLVLLGLALATFPALANDNPRDSKKSDRSFRHYRGKRGAQRLVRMHPWQADEYFLSLGMNCRQRDHLNRLDEAFTDRIVELMHDYYSQPTGNILRFQEKLNQLNRLAERHAVMMLTPVQRHEITKYPWQVYSLSPWDDGFAEAPCLTYRDDDGHRTSGSCGKMGAKRDDTRAHRQCPHS